MSYSEPYQTVVYDSLTGDIIKIMPGQYIKSRTWLNRRLGMETAPTVKFFYHKGMFPIDPDKFRVGTAAPGSPPRLVTIDGTDPCLDIFREEGKWTLFNYKNVLFRFEGGLGDYLDQADALISARKLYPKTKIAALLNRDRIKALHLLEGFDGTLTPVEKQLPKNHPPILEFSGITRVNGRYPAGGKVGVYSAIAGLPGPARRAPVRLLPAFTSQALTWLEPMVMSPPLHMVALHTMSGNTNAKSLTPAQALPIIEALLAVQDVWILHLGGAGEQPIEHERVISLQGKLSWLEVFHLIAQCKGCVCIDSAIMHIAQHLEIPTVSFWGPTAPEIILDTPPGVETIVTSAPCKGCGLYDCDRDECMGNFSKVLMTRKFKKMLEVKNA